MPRVNIFFSSSRFWEMSWKREIIRTRPSLQPRVPVVNRSRRKRVVDRIVEVVRLLGHADLRWHLWIVLAFLGRLEVALAAYALYFVLRSLAGLMRKGVRYA